MAVSSTVGVVNDNVAGQQGPQTMFPPNRIVITPSDDTFKLPVTVLVQTAGDVVFTPYGGQADITLTFTSAQVPCAIENTVKAVKSGTTATVHGVW